MSDYEIFVSRHSECSAQALVERLERYEGVSPAINVSLKDRWIVIMGKPVIMSAQAMVK